MIELHDANGRARFVAAEAIASVAEAGNSSQWHGIRSFVKLFDGEVIECSKPAADVAAAVRLARAAGATL